MKAVIVDESSGERALIIREIDAPNPQKGEVLIAVRAAGVNRADLLQRAGKYPPPAGVSTVMGLEVSGVVTALGEGVSGLSLGDEVCALLAGGGYAERVAVPAEQVFPKPPGLTFEESAAIPEAFITAYANLLFEGRHKGQERVLIHGGSSGVGTAAIQLARVLGAEVACTVGSAKKADACRRLGASMCIDYKEQDFESTVLEWTAGAGVDLVLDIIGAEYFAKNLVVLAPKGRLVIIAVMGGSRTEVDLSVIMRKRLSIVGSVLRGRSIEEKGSLVQGFASRFLSMFGSDLLPVVDSCFAFDSAEKAHARMKSSEHIGKIVLTF